MTMVIQPSLDKLYCQTDTDTNSLVVIDCATNQVCATLPLPEPCYEGEYPTLACDTIDGKVYALNYGPRTVTLYAINCFTDVVCARIEFEGDDVYSFCWEPVLNRIYCAADTGWDTELYVIDCTTDSIVNAIPFTGDIPMPSALCANPTGTRIYAWDEDNGELEVFDAIAGRSVMRERFGDGWGTLCYNPAAGKLYIALEDDDRVVVLDPDDTWAADIPVNRYPCALACSPRSNTVLCVSVEDPRVALIDGAGDSIRCTVRTALALTDIAVNEPERKLYALDFYGMLVVIDEPSGQVLRQVDVFPEVPYGNRSKLFLHEDRDKLYCVRSHEIAVVDCADDTVIARIELPGETPIACLSTIADRLYVSTRFSAGLAVIDCATDDLVRTITPDHKVQALCCDSAGRAWFSASDSNGIIGSIVGDTVAASIPVPGWGRAICYNPVNDRIYAAFGDNLVVVDPARESIVGIVDLESGYPATGLCINTINNRLYAQASGLIVIVDCTDDSVLTRLPAWNYRTALLYDPDANRLYYTYDTVLVTVDGAADTVIARFNVTNGWAGLAFSRISHRLYHAGRSEIAVFHCPPPVHAAIGETGPTLISREITLLGIHPADLIDVTGRRVLRLKPGLNRLDALPAGVFYLLRPIDRYTQNVILRP
jgi:DNA-binding beta-propeller fold protein YncE